MKSGRTDGYMSASNIGFVHRRNYHSLYVLFKLMKRLRIKKNLSLSIFTLITFLSVILASACAPRNVSNAVDVPSATASSLYATTETAAYPPGSRLDKILISGEIVVATSPDFAPMEFIDNRKDGQEQYVGTDPWFAKYIAEKLGVKLNITAMSFDSLETALASGSADLIMSGLAATESRAESFELSDFYNVIADDICSVIVRKDVLGDYRNAGDFKGKIIAVEDSTPQYNFVQEQLPEAKPEIITQINDGVMLLVTKKADALAVGKADGLAIRENYPDLALSDFKFEYETEGNVIGIPKGEITLLERINEIISMAVSEDLFNTWLKDAKILADEIGWQN